MLGPVITKIGDCLPLPFNVYPQFNQRSQNLVQVLVNLKRVAGITSS